MPLPGNNRYRTVSLSAKSLSENVLRAITSTDSVDKLLQSLDSRLQRLEAGRSWSIEDETINEYWLASELLIISSILESLLLRLYLKSEIPPSSQTIIHWLRIASGCNFFASLQPTQILSQQQVERLQANTAVLCISFLRPAAAIASLADGKSISSNMYFMSSDAATEIHSILFAAAESCIPQAAPAVLGWVMILNEIQAAASRAKDLREEQRAIEQSPLVDPHAGRRNSYGSLQQSAYEDIIEHIINASPVAEAVNYLLTCTLEAGHAIEVISSLAMLSNNCSLPTNNIKLELLQELVIICTSTLGYTSDLLSTQFALLTASAPIKGSLEYSDLAEAFIKSDFLIENMFDLAAARFPYESLPFIRLCKFLAKADIFDDQGTQYVTYRLRTMNSFTQVAYGSFASYQTVREDENLNLVALENDASMIGKLQHKMITYGGEDSQLTVIPAETVGEVISEGSPAVVRWRHSFSGLSLLGLWLGLHYGNQLQPILSPSENAGDVVADIIDLITTLLTSTLSDVASVNDSATRRSLQDTIFDETHANLEGGLGVVDFIFEIAEQELHAFRRRPSQTFNTSLLIACVDFMSVFVKIRPDQFWSFINKSSLLGMHGADSVLVAVVNGVEAPSQQFDFLESCSHLYKSVIDACLTPSQSFNLQAKQATRSLYPQSVRVQSSVLTSLTESLYGAFDLMPAWTFGSHEQKLRVTNELSDSFKKIILYARGIGESTSKFRSCFILSCESLIARMRPQKGDVVGATSIVRHLLRIAESRTHDNMAINFDEVTLQFGSVLSLANILVRSGMKNSEPVSSLETELFNTVPLLLRIFCSEPSSSTTILHLLRDLIDVIAPVAPVSLLGHLGSVSSLCLLDMLEDQQIAGDGDSAVATWQLLTRLVGRNQQWLALIILTGTPPEKGRIVKDALPEKSRGQIFINTVLDRLVKTTRAPQQLTISMLEFLAEAQQNWSWTSSALQTRKDLWPALVSSITDVYIDATATLQLAYRNKIAALVTGLATTHLHHARVTQNSDQTKVILSLLQWLAKNAIEVRSYNSSLHANLTKNFAAKFGGLSVIDFKRSGLLDTEYGGQYYYDLEFAGQILHAEQYWARQGLSADQSFSAEFRRANLNLSLVDSELTLLRSLQDFCVEHCGWAVSQSTDSTKPTDKTFHETLVQIIQNCLKANTHDYPSQKIFETLFQQRADLTIIVLQQLTSSKAKGFDTKALLKVSWECATYRNGSYEKAIANDDMIYWRSMLTIVLLTLQFHVGGKWLPPVADHSSANLMRYTINDQIPTVLEIITIVIGQGLRSVVSTIQDRKRVNTADDETVVTPKDVALILTIFETILRMSRLTEFAVEASERLISSGVIQSCLLLYSWSHTQIKSQIDGEPTYADSCLQFLAALSSLPPVTEEMAVEGVLSRLLTARVTQTLQSVPDGVGHLDRRPHCLVLYRLWSTGILPICLNLLHSVGAPIAAEVSVFLNQFPKQLDRASTAFISEPQSKSRDSNAITLTVANEAATAALISFILSSYRSAGASAAIDPTMILSLTGYDEHKKALKEDISDVLNLSVQNLKMCIIPTTEKELHLAKTKDGDSDLLTKKIQSELRNALTCLKGQEIEGDEKQ